MAPETARIVLYVISAAAVVVWLFALQFLIASRKALKGKADQQPDAYAPTDSNSEYILYGSAEVAGEPEELSPKAASLLANGSMCGAIKVLEQSAERLRFEPSGVMAGKWFRHGVMHFHAAGSGKTRIDYALELVARNWLLGVGVGVQILGLIALLVLFLLLHAFVVDSPNPGTRWQTIQMVQVSHFLWPPFLFAGLYRSGGKMLRTQFETFVHNLPYARD